MNAKKIIAAIMLVLGIGMVVFAFSDYIPAGELAGWSQSCRWMMAVGAMLAVGGKLLS